MIAYRWSANRAYSHLGKIIHIPMWDKIEEAPVSIEALVEWLNENSVENWTWWQIYDPDNKKRRFFQYFNIYDSTTLVQYNEYTQDPTMGMLGANYAAKTKHRFTGEISPVLLYSDDKNWIKISELRSYEFLGQLAEQFKFEKEKYEARKSR